ncbi:trypco2 family protein [Geodermatophilus sp. SYSU D00710]
MIDGIGIDEAIQTLRAQLSSAVQSSQGQDLRFRLGPIELEFTVVATDSGKVGGGIKFWVVSAEAEAARSQQLTHIVRLKLEPVRSSSDEPVLAGDEPQAVPN